MYRTGRESRKPTRQDTRPVSGVLDLRSSACRFPVNFTLIFYIDISFSIARATAFAYFDTRAYTSPRHVDVVHLLPKYPLPPDCRQRID
eukprot:2720386-Prymnesium_polylepis.1